jgi:hypothetical protein
MHVKNAGTKGTCGNPTPVLAYRRPAFIFLCGAEGTVCSGLIGYNITHRWDIFLFFSESTSTIGDKGL